jgi:hypothetical protein
MSVFTALFVIVGVLALRARAAGHRTSKCNWCGHANEERRWVPYGHLRCAMRTGASLILFSARKQKGELK